MLRGCPADGGNVRPGDCSACCRLAGELHSWSSSHSEALFQSPPKEVYVEWCSKHGKACGPHSTKTTSGADERLMGGWGDTVTGPDLQHCQSADLGNVRVLGYSLRVSGQVQRAASLGYLLDNCRQVQINKCVLHAWVLLAPDFLGQVHDKVEQGDRNGPS